jgi:Zn-finger nucleic acid-binding protein
MSDVYREAGHACPNCHSPLRSFNHRWVCDACGGMLLGVTDLEQALVDVGALNMRVVDDTPTEKRCPRCEGRLRACLVQVDGAPLDEDILHCERHGLWLGPDMLETIFTSLSRRAHRHSGTGRSYGGAGGGGAIRKWWEKPRPMVHTPFTSTLAGKHLPCPLCTKELVLRGRLWACDDHGVFVEHAALAEMMSEMTHGTWNAPGSGTPGKRACPACATAMTENLLDAVTVDSCAQHGVWFDPGELEASLEHAGEHPSWLRRLFG